MRPSMLAGLAFAALPAAFPVLAQGPAAPAAAPAPAKSPEPAPGRGEQPTLTPHSAQAPALYALEAQPVEQLSPLIARQYLHGGQTTFVRWTFKAGAVVPLHHHASEQITWITKGRAEVYSGGHKYVMQAGDVMIIPPNVPHEFVFTEDTIDIDIFAPQRQDWIDGAAGYLKQ